MLQQNTCRRLLTLFVLCLLGLLTLFFIPCVDDDLAATAITNDATTATTTTETKTTTLADDDIVTTTTNTENIVTTRPNDNRDGNSLLVMTAREKELLLKAYIGEGDESSSFKSFSNMKLPTGGNAIDLIRLLKSQVIADEDP